MVLNDYQFTIFIYHGIYTVRTLKMSTKTLAVFEAVFIEPYCLCRNFRFKSGLYCLNPSHPTSLLWKRAKSFINMQVQNTVIMKTVSILCFLLRFIQLVSIGVHMNVYEHWDMYLSIADAVVRYRRAGNWLSDAQLGKGLNDP